MNGGPTVSGAGPILASNAPLEVRKIGSHELRDSLSEGWSDFLDKRGDLILLGLLYPVIGLFTATLSLGAKLLPLLFPVVAGITLLGPVAATGFYELARRREEGKDASWRHFLDVRHRPARNEIVVLCVILLAIFGMWMGAATGIYVVLIGAFPDTLREFLATVFTTPEGWALIVIGTLVGLCFAAVVLTITVVSMPMLVDRDVTLGAAMTTSVRAVMANKRAMIRWGLTVAALLVLGSIPLFIGLAIALPVLGYATWHLYTKLVIRPAH